jgi:hypothetical protein
MRWLFRGKVVMATEFGFAYNETGERGCTSAFECGSSRPPPADISMGRNKRATRSGRVLEISSGRDWLGSRFNVLWTARGRILALRPLALVDLLVQPSLDGLSTVAHVTAHPIADRAVALVSPAVQSVNGDAHFRDICERHQLVTGLKCHDHLPFVDRSPVAPSWGRRVSVAIWEQSPRHS